MANSRFHGPILNLLLGMGTFTDSPPLERVGKQPKEGARERLLRVFSIARRSLLQRDAIDAAIYTAIAANDPSQLFRALELHISEAAGLAARLMRSYRELPKEKSLALLGLVALVSPSNQDQILSFLCERLHSPAATHTERALVRRAGLALAVAGSVNPETVQRVTSFFTASHDYSLELPVVEFFRSHAAFIGSLPSFDRMRLQIAGSDSFFREQVLEALADVAQPGESAARRHLRSGGFSQSRDRAPAGQPEARAVLAK